MRRTEEWRAKFSLELFRKYCAIKTLYYGAFQSLNPITFVLKIRALESHVFVLDCDKETGIMYGEIKAALNKKGKKIPDNDIWIAAMAKRHDLELVTRDKHFSFVEGIDVVKWCFGRL